MKQLISVSSKASLPSKAMFNRQAKERGFADVTLGGFKFKVVPNIPNHVVDYNVLSGEVIVYSAKPWKAVAHCYATNAEDLGFVLKLISTPAGIHKLVADHKNSANRDINYALDIDEEPAVSKPVVLRMFKSLMGVPLPKGIHMSASAGITGGTHSLSYHVGSSTLLVFNSKGKVTTSQKITDADALRAALVAALKKYRLL